MNKKNKKQKAGEQGRVEGYDFEAAVRDAINEAGCDGIVASNAPQNVPGSINPRARNKIDINVSIPNSDILSGVSIKNPSHDGQTIQMMIAEKVAFLKRLSKVKKAPAAVTQFFDLFLGDWSSQKFQSDCDRLGVLGESLEYHHETRRNRALFDSIPEKYSKAFLNYFNDIAIKREILEVVFKRGMTTLSGVDFMVWCESSLAGKSNTDNLVGYPVDALIDEIHSNYQWEPKLHLGRLSTVHLGPLGLQVKGSGGIDNPNNAYHGPQFRANLSNVLKVLPSGVVVKATAAEIMPALFEAAA